MLKTSSMQKINTNINLNIKIGEKYTHYKNKKNYIIIALAHDTETLSKQVIYQGLYTDKEFGENPIWVRDYDEFCDDVLVDGVLVGRFSKTK